MRMDDPAPTFAYFARELGARHPSLAYLHVIEPRTNGPEDREVKPNEVCSVKKISIDMD